MRGKGAAVTSQSDELPRIPPPALIGDIGGTNARFALVTGDAMTRFPDEQGADYATIDDAIEAMINTKGPVIFDCHIAKLANCFPMIPSGKAHNEMLLGDEVSDETIGSAIGAAGKALV